MDKIFSHDGQSLYYRDARGWSRCSLDNGAVNPLDRVPDYEPTDVNMTLFEAVARLGPNFGTIKSPKKKPPHSEDNPEGEMPDRFI